jgi:hypothetical protein
MRFKKLAARAVKRKKKSKCEEWDENGLYIKFLTLLESKEESIVELKVWVKVNHHQSAILSVGNPVKLSRCGYA